MLCSVFEYVWPSTCGQGVADAESRMGCAVGDPLTYRALVCLVLALPVGYSVSPGLSVGADPSLVRWLVCVAPRDQA